MGSTRFPGMILVLGAVLSFVLGACAAAPDRRVALDDTLRAYERTLRWDDMAKAVRFQREPGEAPDRSRMRGLRVTGYQVLSRKLDTDEQGLSQTVELTYFREDEAVERRVTDEQRWVYDAERKAWLLETPLPRFR